MSNYWDDLSNLNHFFKYSSLKLSKSFGPHPQFVTVVQLMIFGLNIRCKEKSIWCCLGRAVGHNHTEMEGKGQGHGPKLTCHEAKCIPVVAGYSKCIQGFWILEAHPMILDVVLGVDEYLDRNERKERKKQREKFIKKDRR